MATWQPAIAATLRREGSIPVPLPLWISPDGVVRGAADALAHNPSITGEVRKRLLAALHSAGGSQAMPAAGWREQALARILEQVPGADRGWLKQALPGQGWVAPPDEAGVALAYATMLMRQRAAARERMTAEVRQHRARMADRIAADDAQSPESPQQLAAGLGREAGQFFDTGSLARALGRTAVAAHKIPAHRRERIRSAIEAFDVYLETPGPACWVLGAGEAPAGLAEAGAGYRKEDEPARSAFPGTLFEQWATLLLALRIARLEAESAFDERIHGPRLDRFSLQSAQSWEIEAAPAVLLLEQPACPTLDPLLRSGFPVHFLIARQGLGGGGSDAILPDPAAVARSHGGVFVLESSLARPDHLLAGLERMTGCIGPAVAVFNATVDAVEAHLVDSSRAFPLSVCDPAWGDTWAARLRLTSIPEPEAALAEAAAMDPALREEMEWIEGAADVPSIEAANGDATPGRAAISPRVAAWTRDRLSARRRLEELAGVANIWAQRAAEAARLEVETAAAAREQAALDRGRAEGKTDAVRNLMASLLGAQRPAAAAQSGAVVAPAARAAVAAAATPQPAATATPAAGFARAPDPAPAPAEEDPFVDSALCTSCNDCMKVNPRLFRYNANQQAYLADPAAGTFAELVKAAEGCPARCIHVGSPRPGDATATPALIAKSAKWK